MLGGARNDEYLDSMNARALVTYLRTLPLPLAAILFDASVCLGDTEPPQSPSPTPSSTSTASLPPEPKNPEQEREERAQALFRRGVALAAEERWPEAERMFGQSFELVPRPSTAFNRALALYRLGRMLDVVATIDGFLTLTDPQKDGAQRTA